MWAPIGQNTQMMTLAKLASPLNWRYQKNTQVPHYYLFTDRNRLPDPRGMLKKLPKGTCIVVRHCDLEQLHKLAKKIIPLARRMHLKVFISNDIRLAIRLGADGVHLSEGIARQGPQRIQSHKKNFICSAAAHSQRALWRAKRANAEIAMISPVFPTKSHKDSKGLGLIRTLRFMQNSKIHSVALGGLSPTHIRRLKHQAVRGLAAIDGWDL